MRSLLLDTHAFLWFIFDDPRLSEGAAAALSRPRTELSLSVASLWEITIKHQLGKLELGMDLDTFLREYIELRELNIMPVSLAHLRAYSALDLRHRDPFDRLLVAQATCSGMPLVSGDPAIRCYEVEVVW